MLELDLLLQGFLKHSYAALDGEERMAFAALLELADQRLFELLVQSPPQDDSPQARLCRAIRDAARQQ